MCVNIIFLSPKTFPLLEVFCSGATWVLHYCFFQDNFGLWYSGLLWARDSGGFHHMIFYTCCILKVLTQYRIDGFSNKSGSNYFDFPQVPGAGGVMSREYGRKWDRCQSVGCGATKGKEMREHICSAAKPQKGLCSEDPAWRGTHKAKSTRPGTLPWWGLPRRCWQSVWWFELKA